MANFKRGKPRRQVRCTLCTQHRWKGNSTDRHKKQTRMEIIHTELGKCLDCGGLLTYNHVCPGNDTQVISPEIVSEITEDSQAG